MTQINTYQSLFFVPLPPTQISSDMPWRDVGNQVQPTQPPAPRNLAKVGALTATGLFLVLTPPAQLTSDTPWKILGGEVQPPQPPKIVPRSTLSDTGLSLVLSPPAMLASDTPWRNIGWEIQPPPPPHLSIERRAGAVMRGDDGSEGLFAVWRNFGWEYQAYQPPHHLFERAGSIQFGDNGTEAQFIPPPGTITFGFDAPPIIPRVRFKGAMLAGWDGMPQGALLSWVNDGWEIAPHQPQHPRIERAGLAPFGDLGIEATQVNWRNDGWEIQSHQPSHPRPERSGAIQSLVNIEAPLFAFGPYGWAIDPPQPPHPRPERAGSIQPISTINASLFGFQHYGWEIAPHQPNHPRVERSGSIQFGDTGTEAQFVPPPIPITWAYDSPYVIARVRLERSGAVQPISVIESLYVAWKNAGWEIQPPQPPHRAPEIKGAAFLRGDDGYYDLRRVWFNGGWEVQSYQPQHQRPERVGAILFGDTGAEAKFVPPPSPITWAYDGIPATTRTRFERAGALQIGDYGIAAPAVTFRVYGWEIPSPQPPHLRTEKAGVSQPLSVIDALYVAWRNAGWEIPQPQPPHPRPERVAPIIRSDDGTQAIRVEWRNTGWEVQPLQPPHRAPESKAATFLRGIDGTEARFIFITNLVGSVTLADSAIWTVSLFDEAASITLSDQADGSATLSDKPVGKVTPKEII